MRLYGAIDLHSNNSVAVILDEQDRPVYERRLPNDLSRIKCALAPYREQLTGLAVESTYNWYWLVDGLMEDGYQLHLVNTAAVKHYEGLKHTDDEHDARWLAHLLRLGILPEGYIYPKEKRGLRDLLRKRAKLIRHRTAQILSVLNRLACCTSLMLDGDSLWELSDEEIDRLLPDANQALAVKSNLVVMRALQEQIERVEKEVLRQMRPDFMFQKLQTVDGIGKILGLTISLETGDIARFPTVGDYASYARCVNSIKISNGKKKGEANRKNGNKYLAWAYVEAAHFAIRSQERIRRFYQRKSAQRNKIVAVKAVAHKLARACYGVMRDNVPFEVERAFA